MPHPLSRQWLWRWLLSVGGCGILQINHYTEFVFTDLKHIIAKQVGEAFADDAALQQRYGNDVFIQCRDICVNMLREAYKGADQT